jgi:CRISPR/Cas system-associated endoribonuclease Cas2
LKESPFGDDIYVVVVKESEKIAEKLSKLYQQAKDEIAVVVLTLEEYRNFETLLSEKGEKLY